MNLIDRLAHYFTDSIRRHYPEASSEIALMYSLSLLINTSISVTITLLFCAFTDHLTQAVIVIFTFTLLRYVSGGCHMPTSISCCITSILLLTFMAHMEFHYWYLGFLMDLASFIVFWRLAPEGIEETCTIDPKFYPLLKLISLSVVMFNLYFHSSLLSVICFIQALTLTPPAYKLIGLLERR